MSQTKPVPPADAHPTAQTPSPQPAPKQNQVPRAKRFASHALVELRRYKHLPFGVHSAVLLDLSISGFKFEFTGEMQMKPGQTFWLNIPLAPLGIYAPSKLMCKGECRWFDEKKFRAGGVFMELSSVERHVIDQIIDALSRRGAISS